MKVGEDHSLIVVLEIGRLRRPYPPVQQRLLNSTACKPFEV